MKEIIPFKKQVIFKTNISEITSISLEHTLSLDNNVLSGNFIINGEYKITDSSNTVEPFNLELPFKEVIDGYDLSTAIYDIDDFYYEIINDNVLSVCIDILLDKLEVKEDEDIIEEDTFRASLLSDDVLPREEERIEIKDKLESVFDNIESLSDNYVSYNIYIVRAGDSIESIMEKYNVTKEELESYNDLTNIVLGDKIIIPTNYERTQ